MRILLLLCFFILLGLLSCALPGRGQPGDASSHGQMEWYSGIAAGIVSGMTPAERASQVLMTSIDGKEAFPRHLYDHFRGAVPGAVILFGYNIADTPSGVRSYLASCNGAFSRLGARVPVLFAVDNEGGSVFRTARVTARLPSAASVRSGNSEEGAERLYFAAGRSLAALGISMNLAPVAEPGLGEGKDFLGDRAYGDTPAVSSSYALSAMRGYRRAGVIPVAKHFPGSSLEDPHASATALPVSRRELDSRYRASFAPLVSEGLPAILVSGVRVPALDPDVPFCLSRRGVTEYLREGMGFSGLVITDDISMKAISAGTDDTARAAVLAIRAGCDLVMTSTTNLRQIAGALEDEAARDPAFASALERAVTRIVAAKISAGLVPTPLRSLARDIAFRNGRDHGE